MAPSRRQASPEEIAAALMDAVCTPVEAEQEALRHLARHLRVDYGVLQTELVFLKAYAAGFATDTTLGEGPQRDAVLERYYGHWGITGQEVGEGVTIELQERLRLYAEAVNDSRPEAHGLQEGVGRVFSRCCGHGEAEELVVLGGALFGVLFSGIGELLEEIEIVLDEDQGS